MSIPKQIKDRYEIRKVLGQGGMGIVYEAYDAVVNRPVALKTVRDTPSRTALDLFHKECAVLAAISHPNIVEIFDLGEFDENGANKPYFVMPLLPGKTLAELIAGKSRRLTVDRVVEIICQTCRGLQAAHEHGLVHRDLKPGNILVMDDDSVKVIDFGSARMADAQSTVGHKGTLLYMAPEQVELKPPSAHSDIFAAGVVTFEALTLRHPFERGNTAEVASAILRHLPPPASEWNPLVNKTISRVIRKAMAKQPCYRFESAREFAEALQKAARNEPIEMFDLARIQPRLEQLQEALQQGDYEFADEILTGLEVEGHASEAIVSLRRRLNESQRQKMTAQLIERARTLAEQQEYPLALQKIKELLAVDPEHEAALELQDSLAKRSPSSARSERDATMESYERARNHVAAGNFALALEICDGQLSHQPGHPLFQSLKLDVEERQRQELSRRIAEVAQLLESEADLEKQVGILTETLERQPGETYFVRALQTTRDRRDLVNAIVNKARFEEDRGHYSDALEQWEILKTIYGRYPGLDFEMQRVRCRRDGQLPPTVPPVVSPPRRKALPWLIAAGIAGLMVFVGGLITTAKARRHPSLQTAPAPAPLSVAAVAAPSLNTVLQVYADLKGGRIVLDDQPVGELQDGQLTLESLAAGTHTVKIGGFREQASIRFTTAAGTAPIIDSISAREAVAITVTSSSGRAKVQTSLGSMQVSVDGAPAGETGTAGLELRGLARGNHQLTLAQGKESRTIFWSIGVAPTLTAFLKSDRNVGTLVVVTGQDGVRVSLNGREHGRQTQSGQLRIPDLDVKAYTIRVAKVGFLDTPEQQVDIRKGQEVKLEFHLTPLPKVASLVIAGGLAGAEVLLDQSPIGVVHDDGSFTASRVPPGDHAIELRKEFYKPKRIEKHFEADGSVQLSSADVAMEKLPGMIRIAATPPDARVTISREGEAPKPLTGPYVTVAEGSYTLAAHAANYTDRSISITIAPGETKNVELVLEPARMAKTPTPVQVLGMSDWDDPAAWVTAGNWHIRKGGNFVGYKPAHTTGAFSFTIELRKGKRLQWAAARTDDRNYLLFQMDGKFFYRRQMVNGKETQLKKAPHGMEKRSAYTIQMDVADDSIVHKLWDGSSSTILDEWQEPGRKFGNGKFGFVVPGGTTIAVDHFTFTPR